ncbi:MAG: class I SAM-dependent methyltransferase [Ginsengibacter sp.]
MGSLTKRIIKRIRWYFKLSANINNALQETKPYDFNISNPLGGNGERVDIQLQYSPDIDFNKLDMYQQNHYRRYEFAKQMVKDGDICGDFACGTGYGSVMVSGKVKEVIGADLDTIVINAIQERYSDIKNVKFLNENLLHLSYSNYFDTILSFETIEHFAEEDIERLLKIFAVAIKKNGQLIFSTPYMQEKSENAMKLGFHLTFNINEDKIGNWLNNAGFEIELLRYQNYDTHTIECLLEKKDFIICVANKKENA